MGEMEQDNLELVPVSEQRRLYPDYGAWIAACRDNPGPSSSYTCPVSGISKFNGALHLLFLLIN